MTPHYSFSDYTISAPSINSMEMHVTEHATALPDGKPTTEDMRNMVDHMMAMGLIQRKPAAFAVKDAFGQESIHIHPTLHGQLMRRVRCASKSMEREMERRAMGFFR